MIQQTSMLQFPTFEKKYNTQRKGSGEEETGANVATDNPAQGVCNQLWHATSQKIDSSPFPGFSLIPLSQI